MRKILLRNFKSLVSVDVPLGSLTLLAGLNGAGKSSVIQALLSLRQSYSTRDLVAGNLVVGGDLVDMGGARDVLSEGADSDEISIGLEMDSGEIATFHFEVRDGETRGMAVSTAANAQALDVALADNVGAAFFTGDIAGTPTGFGFHYLQAERIGPRKFLPMAGSGSRPLLLGSQGEYVLHTLLERQDFAKFSPDDPRRIVPIGDTLRTQIEGWLGEVSPGARLDLTSLAAADLVVGTYSFGQESELRSREFRATNVGFGLSYILPVLTALLLAPTGGMVIVENPEAHLHPKGQTRLGELCARAAAAGIRVLVETHSDHFMDGARIAVRERILAPESIKFHYFARSGAVTQITTPTIDDEGRLSEWPEGFFDQHRRNAGRLLRPIAK